MTGPDLSEPMYVDEPCKHGIDPITCAVCLRGPEASPAPETAERFFTARYAGHCTVCDLPIRPGETVAVTAQQRYLHKGCVG